MYDFNGQLVQTASKACFVEDTTCAFTDTSTNTVTSSALCDLHIYVAWTGIDGAGNYFESAAMRFSRLLDSQLTNYTTTLAKAKSW